MLTIVEIATLMTRIERMPQIAVGGFFFSTKTLASCP
jgi:hypothetical protein